MKEPWVVEFEEHRPVSRGDRFGSYVTFRPITSRYGRSDVQAKTGVDGRQRDVRGEERSQGLHELQVGLLRKVDLDEAMLNLGGSWTSPCDHPEEVVEEEFGPVRHTGPVQTQEGGPT